MKKKRFLWLICSLMAIVGCTGDVDNPVYQQKEITLKNFSNTGCKPSTRAENTDFTDGSYFELTATQGNMLYVKHVNAVFNCSSRLFEAKADETYGCEDIFKDYSSHEMKIFYIGPI